MKTNTAQVLEWIGLSEGGYVNHPKDPGGATDRGITQRTYDAWNVSKGRPKKTVRGISKSEADQIVFEQYMRPIRFNDLPSGLDYAVADFSVNSGPSRAAKELQKVLGFSGRDVDGNIGQLTLAAVAKRDITRLISDYSARRLAFLKGLKTWGTFGKGWERRVSSVAERAIDMAHGAPTPTTSMPRTPKARDEDTAESTWVKKALEEPSVWIPAAGGVLSGFTDGDGPMQWAIAAVIVIGAVYAAVRLLKKST